MFTVGTVWLTLCNHIYVSIIYHVLCFRSWGVQGNQTEMDQGKPGQNPCQWHAMPAWIRALYLGSGKCILIVQKGDCIEEECFRQHSPESDSPQVKQWRLQQWDISTACRGLNATDLQSCGLVWRLVFECQCQCRCVLHCIAPCCTARSQSFAVGALCSFPPDPVPSVVAQQQLPVLLVTHEAMAAASGL